MPLLAKITTIGLLLIAFHASSQLSPSQLNDLDSIAAIQQRRPNKDTIAIESLLLKGRIYFDAKVLDSCEPIYFRGLKRINAVGTREFSKKHLELKSKAYQSLGVFYAWTAQAKSAQEYFHKSLTINQEMQSIRGIVFNLNALMSTVGNSRGDSIAYLYYSKSHRVRSKITDSFENAMNWETIAKYHQVNRRDNDSAIFWLIKSLEVYEKLEKPQQTARVAQQLGTLFSTKDNPKVASEYLYKALDIEEQLDNTIGIMNVRLALANLCTLEQDYAKAVKMLKVALKLSRTVQSANREANILCQIGINYQHIDSLEAAESHLLEALHIVESHSLGASKMAFIYAQLAVVFEKKGDKSKALEYVLKGLNSNNPNNPTLIYQYLHAGHLYFELGNYEMAKEYTLKSLNAARLNGSQFELKEVHMRLEVIYKQEKDFEKALFHSTRFHAIKDSITDLEGHRILVQKEADYQIAQKEQELELERKSSDLLKQEQRTQQYLILGLSLLLISSLLTFFIFYQRKRLVALQANNEIMRQLHEITSLKSRLQTAMMKEPSEGQKASSINDYLDIPLSQRELEVLEELTQGKSNKEISESLCISVNTVSTHLKKVYFKLDVSNRTQAVKKASALRA